MILVITLAYLIIMVIAFIRLYIAKQKKELWIYASLMTLTYVLCVLLLMGVKLPSPQRMISNFISKYISSS